MSKPNNWSRISADLRSKRADSRRRKRHLRREEAASSNELALWSLVSNGASWGQASGEQRRLITALSEAGVVAPENEDGNEKRSA